MTILESLREKKESFEKMEFGYSFYTVKDTAKEIIQAYDLALENALLKLKNRGVEIKDLKHRLGEYQQAENDVLEGTKRERGL